MSNIPLHCNICPKKPKFSDVSHLLTHIASKGHLSHYYKVKVRSSTEEDCRELIETYDHWYSKHKVEDLMSERMNLKDKRRSRAVRNQAAVLPRTVSLPRPRPVRQLPNHDGILDPRLGDLRSRGDPRMAISQLAQSQATSHQHILHPPAPHRHHPNTVIPPHYHVPYRSQAHYTHPGGGLVYSHQQYAPCMVPSGGTVTHDMDIPYKRRRSELYDDQESEETFSSRSFSVHGSASIDKYDEGCEEPSESTKLKGVFWPGMDIFDSATPEMKRKRNQKKDTSVVEQLEANSLDVEPMEMIFTPLGTLKKARKISGNPEDDESSPIRGDTSPIRQYSTFSRPPLVAIPFDPVHMMNASNNNQGPHGEIGRNMMRTLDGRDIEFMYGVQKRKRNFEVFPDKEITFHNPAGFGLLNSEFHLPEQQNATNSSQSELQRHEYKEHSSHHLYDPFHSHPYPNDATNDKENVPVPASISVKSQHMDNHHFFPHGPAVASHGESYSGPNSFSYPTAEPAPNNHDHYNSTYSHQPSSGVFLPSYKGSEDHEGRSVHRSNVSENVGAKEFYR